MFKILRRKPKAKKFEFEAAPDVKQIIDELIVQLEFDHMVAQHIYCVRSEGSTARAYARIWGLSRIFQETAGYPPTYVIEVLSKHYDKLPPLEQKKVLIHELLHIPKTFSGALKSHSGRHHKVNSREVDKWFKKLGG